MMKKFFLLYAFTALFSLNSVAQYVKWGFQFGPDWRGIKPTAMFTDDAGNSYVVGDDQMDLVYVHSIIYKINPQGQLVASWGFRDMHCSSMMNFKEVVSDRTGNIYILGNSTCEEVTAGTITISVAGGEVGSYLLALNPDLSVKYLVNIPDNMLDLAADYHKNVFVTGTDSTQKYDSLGVLGWTNTTAKGLAIDVSPDGRSFITDGIATWRLSPTGSIAWQRLSLGGNDIAYNRNKNNFLLARPGGLTEVELNPFVTTQFPLMTGHLVKCSLYGEVFVHDGVFISKMDSSGSYKGTLHIHGRDFGVGKNGQAFVLDRFDNEFASHFGCNFTTVASDPNFCPSNCRDDGYLVKVSFDAPPIVTEYGFTSACTGQTNPVTYCSEAVFNTGNNFYVELSSPTGGFNNPLNVGTPPNITLPPNLPAGNYRFRINSTSPAITGIPSNTFSILNSPGPLTIVKTGIATLCDSGYVDLIAVDSLGNVINVNWYADMFYQPGNVYYFYSTSDTIRAMDDGFYLAAAVECYNQTTPVEAGTLCRRSNETDHTNLFSIYPNPASEELHLNIHSQITGNCIVQIIDLSGKLQRSYGMKLTEGINRIKMNISDMASGLYIVAVNAGNRTWQKKLVVN
jgi:hypothetical protein